MNWHFRCVVLAWTSFSSRDLKMATNMPLCLSIISRNGRRCLRLRISQPPPLPVYSWRRSSLDTGFQPSDRGQAFLSGLMKEVEMLLGFHKINTTAYHPQTDGLVERFNHTMTSMLAKTVQRGGRDWDQRIPYVLFAYRASLLKSRPFSCCMVGTPDCQRSIS